MLYYIIIKYICKMLYHNNCTYFSHGLYDRITINPSRLHLFFQCPPATLDNHHILLIVNKLKVFVLKICFLLKNIA